MQTLIDLRSDTVTRPSPGMRRAMADADVGDDVYGEDPTVRKLEEKAAELLGQAAGVFVPSGTMANQLAIGVLTRPGDEVIADQGSHCINFEGGAMSALWGAQPRGLAGERGLLTSEQVSAAVRPAHNDHLPRSRLLVLENTHNRGGGSVWSLQRFHEVVATARRHGLSVHLDGARLFNAQVATGAAVADFGHVADTTYLCFSKGLGAPVGSVLCGSPDLIREARRLRKRLGGGMRQSGILAAAGLYALANNVGRLAEDHQNARRLAEGLAGIRGIQVDPGMVETNMVFAEFPMPAAEAVAKLKAVGVLANAEGSRAGVLRMVTHLDVSRADIEEAVARATRALAG